MSTKKTAGRGRGPLLRKLGLIISVALCMMLASCASKATQRLKSVDAEFDKGDYIGLAESIKKDGEKKYGENSAFLYHMDLGVLYHYAEQYEQSNTHLKRAAEIHYDLFTKSVTNEAAALLTNDNVRPYRSKPYELTMLHQIAALNFMLMGDFDGALVESRKAQLLFDEWERTQAAEGKFHTDGMFHLMTSLAYERTGEEDNSHISLYKSVEAFNKGPLSLPEELAGFAHDRFTAGDREDDIGRLGISPNTGDNSWDAKFGQAEIVIVSHLGRAPHMQENNWHGTYNQGGSLTIHTTTKRGSRLDITVPAPPLPAAADGSPRGVSGAVAVKMSLPEMIEYHTTSDHFSATLDGGDAVTSVMLNDIEVQAKKDLDDAWGAIIARTVVRTVIRTLAANEVKNRTSTAGNPLLGALASVATDVATDQMEKADIRMCTLLPHQVHVARIPVEPGAHSVTVEIHNKHGRVIDHKTFSNIDVKRGEKKVLMYNSLR